MNHLTTPDFDHPFSPEYMGDNKRGDKDLTCLDCPQNAIKGEDYCEDCRDNNNFIRLKQIANNELFFDSTLKCELLNDFLNKIKNL